MQDMVRMLIFFVVFVLVAMVLYWLLQYFAAPEIVLKMFIGVVVLAALLVRHVRVAPGRLRQRPLYVGDLADQHPPGGHQHLLALWIRAAVPRRQV